jgi:hypothetical protein
MNVGKVAANPYNLATLSASSNCVTISKHPHDCDQCHNHLYKSLHSYIFNEKEIVLNFVQIYNPPFIYAGPSCSRAALVRTTLAPTVPSLPLPLLPLPLRLHLPLLSTTTHSWRSHGVSGNTNNYKEGSALLKPIKAKHWRS